MTDQDTILIVDDEILLVETIAFNLEKRGLSVLKAFDGESGLKMAMELKPQLVLLDLMLPQLSGWDVCRTLRSSAPYGENLPILILSARNEALDREKSLQAGATLYQTKPFSMQGLMMQIQTLLHSNRSASNSLLAAT